MKFAAVVSLFFALFGLSMGLKHEYCGLPPAVPGLCMAIFHVFTYYPEKNSCELFVYGGCMGNGNRFKTLEECKEMCVEDEEFIDFK